MPSYEERASIRLEAEAILNVVCDLARPRTWATWLRVPLAVAARNGNGDLVDKLLKAGADAGAGQMGSNGTSLLHAAAEGGNEGVLSAFLGAEAKSDVNTKTRGTGRTPLNVAVRCGNVAAADALMLAGADANILDAQGQSPLHLAIKEGYAGVAKNLLLRGADSETKRSCGNFPIHLAARRGQDEVVRNLLHAGAPINCLSDRGWTALGIAAFRSQLSTVKLLVGKGADVTIPCNGGTSLHMAARCKNVDILAVLVEAGADIEARDDSGRTPLHKSIFGRSCAPVLALLQLEADVNATVAETGSTPLHIACAEGNLDAACLLLAWGADENTHDTEGKTPSARIAEIAEPADRPKLERLSKVLLDPKERAWRRRGMLVMCRAHPGRLRLAVEVPNTAEARVRPHRRPRRRARRSQVKVEVTMGGAHHGEEEGAGSRAGTGAGGGGFDALVAWLMVLTEEDVFRTIVEFL